MALPFLDYLNVGYSISHKNIAILSCYGFINQFIAYSFIFCVQVDLAGKVGIQVIQYMQVIILGTPFEFLFSIFQITNRWEIRRLFEWVFQVLTSSKYLVDNWTRYGASWLLITQIKVFYLAMNSLVNIIHKYINVDTYFACISR